MRIGVTGYQGRLGRELVKRGCLPIKASVVEGSQLHQAIKVIEPDIIIHCAAITNVDACEFTPVLASKINTGGTFLLRQFFQGKIIYLSTDYVFDGEKGPYSEDDKPNPLSIYGWSKRGGELILSKDDLIVRTTVLFDFETDNFVTAIIKKAEKGEIIKVPTDLVGSPTFIPHLAEALLSATHLSGVLNIAGNQVISRYHFTKKIAEKYNAKIEPTIYTGKTNRPKKAGLKTEKAQFLNIPIYNPLDTLFFNTRKSEVLDALATVEA